MKESNPGCHGSGRTQTEHSHAQPFSKCQDLPSAYQPPDPCLMPRSTLPFRPPSPCKSFPRPTLHYEPCRTSLKELPVKHPTTTTAILTATALAALLTACTNPSANS